MHFFQELKKKRNEDIQCSNGMNVSVVVEEINVQQSFFFLHCFFPFEPLKTSIVAEKSGEGVAIVINYCRYLSVN